MEITLIPKKVIKLKKMKIFLPHPDEDVITTSALPLWLQVPKASWLENIFS
jgi:hypothetical protein